MEKEIVDGSDVLFKSRHELWPIFHADVACSSRSVGKAVDRLGMNTVVKSCMQDGSNFSGHEKELTFFN